MTSTSQHFTMQDVIALTSGDNQLWIPASAGWWNGAGSLATVSASVYTASIVPHIDLATGVDTKLFTFLKIPKRWNNASSIILRHWWTPSSTNTGSVRWQSAGGAFQAGDDLSSGNVQSSIPVNENANGVVGVIQVTEMSEFLDPLPVKNDAINLMIQRRGSSDTFTGTVRFIGVEVEFISEAPTDD